MLVSRRDLKPGIVGMAELTCTVAYRRSGFLAVNRTRACPYLTGKVFLVIWVVCELASRTLVRHSRAKALRDTRRPLAMSRQQRLADGSRTESGGIPTYDAARTTPLF
jgi:hypothetical protein